MRFAFFTLLLATLSTTGALAREARHIRGLRHGDFRGELILAGADCKFLELQRQLIDQPLRSLGARAVELTLELGDP